MENLVEDYLRKTGLIKGTDYFKEMYISDVQNRWGLDLSSISNTGKTEKRFDFVVKKGNTVYGIETLEAKDIKGFAFVWFTDGIGWQSAKHNLEETFDVLDNLYCIADLENGIISKLI